MPHNAPRDISRRDFLQTTARLTAGAAVVSAAGSRLLADEPTTRPTTQPATQPTTQPTTGPTTQPWTGPDVLRPRTLGATGLVVPASGYGAISTDTPELAARVFDSGFHFVHTSPGYKGHRSYEAIRRVLADEKRREKVVLALKIHPDRIDRELEYFGLDHVDMIVPPKHSVGALSDEDYINAAVKAREAGKVRAIGWACHGDTTGTLKFAAEAGVFDVALISYRGADEEFLAAMKAAKDKGLGVFAMKHGASPRHQRKLEVEPFQRRMKWLLTEGLADSVLLSFTTVSEIPTVLEADLGTLTLPEKAMLRVDRVAAAGACSWCGRCADGDGRCPAGVAIPQTLRYDYYAADRGWTDRARRKYADLPRAAQASACTDCGACERACPRGLPVRRMLAEAHGRLA